MFTASATTHRKRASVKKHGSSRTPGHNDASKDIEVDGISSVDLNYGNRLLSLRAALNEKELQLVELREQHISVVNRGAIARKNWEDALKSKDQVIVQLQNALHAKKCELDRQERVNEENLRRLLQQREEEENVELDRKDRNISHLEAKNAQFVQELVDRQKTITKLRRQLEDRERHCASHLHKIEVINGRVQDLKAALQKKEEVVDNHQNYCQELKASLWKRDSMIGQLQLAEQQLQSSLARQEAEYEALECVKQKLQEDKDLAEKNLVELRQSLDNRENNSQHKKSGRGFREKEGTSREQRRQIEELQRSLESREKSLKSKRRDQQHLSEQNRRLMDNYDSLKQDFEKAQRRQRQLESNLEAVQDRLVNAERIISEAEQAAIVEAARYAPSPERSIAGDQAFDNVMDDFLELEQQSNASVVTGGGLFPWAPRQRSSKLPVQELLEACRPPNSRDSVSSARVKIKDGSKTHSRSPLASESLECYESKQPPMVDNNPRPPKIRSYHERDRITTKVYQSSIGSAKKAEQSGWSAHVPETTKRLAGGNGRLYGQAVAASDVKSQLSSGISQPSSPCRQDVDSGSEHYPLAGGERSPTLIEAFQNSSLDAKKKTLISISTSRKRTSSHLQRSPSLSENSQTPSPTDGRSNFSLDANYSRPATHSNGWSMHENSAHDANRPFPRAGDIMTSNGNKGRHILALRVSRSHEPSEGSLGPSVENDGINHTQLVQGPKERFSRHEMNAATANGATRLSNSRRKIPHGTGRLPPTGTEPQVAKTPRIRESMRPSTPASDNFQGPSENALKSLQDEVMKRERGWRRTEANMRAALCQRLAELNGADQIYDGDEVARARYETKRSLQRRKT